MSHFTSGWLSWWCWFRSLTLPNTWLQSHTPHLNNLTGFALQGRAKLLVTSVPFFLLLVKFVSVLVDWLSVDSEVSCLSSGFSCGKGVQEVPVVSVLVQVLGSLVVSVEDSEGL